MEIGTIGLDMAKNVFQLHGGDKEGAVVGRKALRRAQGAPVALLRTATALPCRH